MGFNLLYSIEPLTKFIPSVIKSPIPLSIQ